MDIYSLKKNLKKDYTGFKNLRIAILADSSTQYLALAIRGYGYELNLDVTVWEADYDAIDITINDTNSSLYTQKNNYIILFFSSKKLKEKFYSSGDKPGFADSFLQQVGQIINTISQKIKTNFIIYNLEEEPDAVFGNFGNKTSHSFVYQVRKINYLLMLLAESRNNIFISDIAAQQSARGISYSQDARLYVNAGVVWSLDFTVDVAVNTIQILNAFTGMAKKCLIMDLDNTMWGGIIGDDGIENIQIGELGIGKAFTQLQKWAKALVQRGIILAVCSKNTEAIAKEPFEKHPDMIIRLNDISVFVANWHNKADNIRYIQSILNIGFDSMVFLDDNPFERELVKTNLPALTVPSLPDDPAEYTTYLNTLNLFETVSFTAEDITRTQQYQEEAKRNTARSQFTDENDFLSSLEMTSEVAAFNAFTIPRVAQLTQRSNQFNLRTIRYTEEDIKQIASSDKFLTFTFTLSDKFGDHGLICVVILNKTDEESMFIDTWIMSCRVLKRGVENFVLNTIVEAARANGAKKIFAEYISTPKNGIVKNLYPDLGFAASNGLYTLNITDYSPKPTFSKIK